MPVIYHLRVETFQRRFSENSGKFYMPIDTILNVTRKKDGMKLLFEVVLVERDRIRKSKKQQTQAL